MTRTVAFFTLFISAQLQANTLYSIKLGTYKYLKSAMEDRGKAELDTFISKGKKFYGLYTGKFENRLDAKKSLAKAKKTYQDAYITIISQDRQESKPKKIKKTQKSKTAKKTKVAKSLKSEKKDYFLIGKEYYNAADYESALAAYDHLLINEPNNRPARLEYARTLYNLGLYKAAKKEFTTVLETNPPKTVQKNINAYLKKIDSQSKKHIFYGLVGIGLGYDDNLNFNTDKKSTDYGGIILQNDTNMTKGFYETVNLNINHLYTTDKFSWSNSIYSYNELQNEDIDDLNFLNFTTALSKNYHKTKISIPLSLSHVRLDGDSYSFTYAITPSIYYQSDDSTSYKVSLKYQDTKISDDKNKDYKTFGTKVSFSKLFDNLRLYSSGALERDERETKVRYDISKDRLILLMGINYSPINDNLISFDYLYNFDHYSRLDSALGYKREDTRTIMSIYTKQQITKRFSTILGYQRAENDSNINSYCYKKNIYNLNYQYNF